MSINLPPPPLGDSIPIWKNWAEIVFRRIKPGPFRIESYAVADVPDATAYTAHIIYVSDETGGAVVAFSDGTNWRRVTDRAIIS